MEESLIELLKLCGLSGGSAGIGALIFYFLKRKVLEEDTAAARSSAEQDMIQRLRDEVARLYDRNAVLMERNTMLQEQIDGLRSEVADLRVKIKASMQASS